MTVVCGFERSFVVVVAIEVIPSIGLLASFVPTYLSLSSNGSHTSQRSFHSQSQKGIVLPAGVALGIALHFHGWIL